MEILGYGEDALTLWAIRNRLAEILRALNDPSDYTHCQVFYRPSFGRSGGETRSEFGEFDFILLTNQGVYLGESKWHGSSERITNGMFSLRDVQLKRHATFALYIEYWFDGTYKDWDEFIALSTPKWKARGLTKPMASATSKRLAPNLQTILESIRGRYNAKPPITNVLLYFHKGIDKIIPTKAGDDFIVIPLDYSNDAVGHFIKLS